MNPKQILIVRRDLNMRTGKIAAQAAHASLSAILNLGEIECGNSPPVLHIPLDDRTMQWITGSFTKICVYVNTEEELLALHEQALNAGLICSLIKDSGRTEFKGIPTHTVLAIGPDASDKIDPITGHLPLM
jgi:PTH2 family peptidyl-tRNA hydrolase